jgi:putative membrane protein
MKTMVLCVDRDDDLGAKAGIAGPVIGRQENLMAAQKLGLADPEDVDTNSILSAISLYDDLIKKGIEAEIVTITGDIHVGFQSDLVLTRQLENLLELVKPDRAILVSDGAEDEYIYPMVSSRVKIDSVKRVFVKQSESLEGFYYLLIRSLKDVKIRTKWVLPLSLVLMIWGTLSLVVDIIRFGESGQDSLGRVPNIGLDFIMILLGSYLVWWAYEFSHKARKLWKALRTGSLAIPFALVAIMLVMVGLFLGLDTVSAYNSTLLPSQTSVAVMSILFIQAAVWPFILAAFSIESGRAITSFLHHGKLRWPSIIALLSIMAIGFIVQGVADAVYYFLVQDKTFETLMIFGEIFIGVLVAVFGAVLSSTLRRPGGQGKGDTASMEAGEP